MTPSSKIQLNYSSDSNRRHLNLTLAFFKLKTSYFLEVTLVIKSAPIPENASFIHKQAIGSI